MFQVGTSRETLYQGGVCGAKRLGELTGEVVDEGFLLGNRLPRTVATTPIRLVELAAHLTERIDDFLEEVGIRIGVGEAFAQETHHRTASLLLGNSKCCGSYRIPAIRPYKAPTGICAVFYQASYYIKMPLFGGFVQRRKAIAISGIDIGSCLNQ